MFTIIGQYQNGQINLFPEFDRLYRSPHANDITSLNGKWQVWLVHPHYGWTFKDVTAEVELMLMAPTHDLDVTMDSVSPRGQ